MLFKGICVDDDDDDDCDEEDGDDEDDDDADDDDKLYFRQFSFDCVDDGFTVIVFI